MHLLSQCQASIHFISQKQLQELVWQGRVLNSKHKDTLNVVHWIQMSTQAHFRHISRVHLNFHCSLSSKSCTSSHCVPAVQLKAWMMRKGSNAKKQATPFESKFEVKLEHRDGVWSWIKIDRPSFAIELCFKFKWKVSVVSVPLTRDKREY